MKRMLLARLLLGIAMLCGGSTRNAHGYAVDIATVFPDSGDFAPRLFLDAAFTQLAPLNTVVWFVMSADNVYSTNGTGGFGPGGVLTSDDILVKQVTVDADANGQLGPGYLYLEPIFLPDSYSNKNVFVYLWNRTTTATNTITPAVGDHFDVLSLGVRVPPPIGNAQWTITQNLNANHFPVAVPEPGVLSLISLGALGLILQRRYRR